MTRPATGLGLALFLLACGTAPTGTARVEAADPPPPADRPDDVVLTFKGPIDGSDRITVTDARATWEHVHWDLPPEPVSLNGVSWDPREGLTLKNQGATRFLPRRVDFASARLVRVEGRDVVALERRKDAVVIHVCDTPDAAGAYEFRVVFRPRGAGPPAASRRGSTRATLRVAADIDGSDELHIDARGARWVHRQWDWPTGVRLNDVPWTPREADTLPNAGPTKFLPAGVDFATARLTRKEGRDMAVLEHTDGGLVIYFGDSLFDRSTYDVTVTFGP